MGKNAKYLLRSNWVMNWPPKSPTPNPNNLPIVEKLELYRQFRKIHFKELKKTNQDEIYLEFLKIYYLKL